MLSFTIHERVREQLSHAYVLILNAAKAARPMHLFSSPQSCKPSSLSNPQLCHFHSLNKLVASHTTSSPPRRNQSTKPSPSHNKSLDP